MMTILNAIKKRWQGTTEDNDRVSTPIIAKTSIPLLDGLTVEEQQAFYQAAIIMEFKAGQVIFHEEDCADCFYIIDEGEAEIVKETQNDQNERHEHVIATLGKEAVVGDMALVENKPRSANFRAKTTLKLSCFKLEAIRANPRIQLILTSNMAKILSEKLRYTNNVTVKSMETNLNLALAKNALGLFMIALFWLLCLYTLSSRILQATALSARSTTPLSVAMIIVFAIGIVTAMNLTGLPYSRFGITLKDWPKKIVQAILYTLPLMLLFVGIKAYFIYMTPNPMGLGLFSGFSMGMVNGHFDWIYYLGMITLYSLFSPVQELLARSAMQSTFFYFLPGSELFRKWNAIILSNLIFATAHSHLSVSFSALTFIPGLFWGWLFHKQRSLIGVCVSHILLGVWVLFIIGRKGIA